MRVGCYEVATIGEDKIRLFRDEYKMMTDTTVNTEIMGWEDMFKAEDKAFCEAVRTGSKSPIDPDGVLMTNAIFQAALESQELGGKEVAVKLL